MFTCIGIQTFYSQPHPNATVHTPQGLKSLCLTKWCASHICEYFFITETPKLTNCPNFSPVAIKNVSSSMVNSGALGKAVWTPLWFCLQLVHILFLLQILGYDCFENTILEGGLPLVSPPVSTISTSLSIQDSAKLSNHQLKKWWMSVDCLLGRFLGSGWRYD